MTNQIHLTSKRILAIAAGTIFLAIALAMAVAPAPFKAESGEAYIRMACFLVIGGWLFYQGLFFREPSADDPAHKANKG